MKYQLPPVRDLVDLSQRFAAHRPRGPHSLQVRGSIKEFAEAAIVPSAFQWPGCCEPFKGICRSYPTGAKVTLVLVHSCVKPVGHPGPPAREVELIKFRF